MDRVRAPSPKKIVQRVCEDDSFPGCYRYTEPERMLFPKTTLPAIDDEDEEESQGDDASRYQLQRVGLAR
jgi:hypothetical protein